MQHRTEKKPINHNQSNKPAKKKIKSIFRWKFSISTNLYFQPNDKRTNHCYIKDEEAAKTTRAKKSHFIVFLFLLQSNIFI
jgi:hypothetical protein